MPEPLRGRFEIMAHEADLNGKLGRHHEEIGLLRQLLAREPALPSLHVSLAQALKALGGFTSDRRRPPCTSPQPDDVRPRGTWPSQTYHFDAGSPAMESALAVRSLTATVARSLRARPRFGARGGRTAFSLIPPQSPGRRPRVTIRELATRVDSPINVFHSDPLRRAPGHGEAATAPIFIVDSPLLLDLVGRFFPAFEFEPADCPHRPVNARCRSRPPLPGWPPSWLAHLDATAPRARR